MYQILVKLVQVAIFFGVMAVFLSSEDRPNNNIAAMAVVAVFVVTIITVAPWLIFKAFEQACHDIERWRRKRLAARESTEDACVEPQFVLDDAPVEVLDQPRRQIKGNTSRRLLQDDAERGLS